jgi:acyl carrier protein
MPGVQEDAALDRLRGIVASVLEIDNSEITPDTHFYDDLSANSLEKVEITVRVQQEFGVSVSSDEAADLGTVEDALRLLRVKGAVD